MWKKDAVEIGRTISRMFRLVLRTPRLKKATHHDTKVCTERLSVKGMGK